MSVLENRDVDRVEWAKRAYSHPAKLLGVDVDFLFFQETSEQIKTIRSLRRAANQVHMATIFLAVGMAIREGIGTGNSKELARSFNALDNAYWPLTFINQVNKISDFARWDAVDDSLTLHHEHYKNILKIFNDDNTERLAEIGITPQKMVRGVARAGYSPNYVETLYKTLQNLFDVVGTTTDKTEVVKEYIGSVLEKVLSGNFDNKEKES